MKKKVIVIVVCVLLAVAVAAMLIPKGTFQKWFGKTDDTINESKYNVMVYVLNEKDQIVGVNVPVESLEEDQIRQKWNILNSTSNIIPDNYKPVFKNTVELQEYTIEDECLKLMVSDDIYNENRKTLESLVWTFVTDEIKELELYVGETLVNEVDGYTIKNLDKTMGVNYCYETSFLFESTATTIVYQEEDYTLPVTYFHLNDDICDYIVMKILTNVDDNVYEYTLEDSVLTIDFVDASILTSSQIASISESIALNFDVTSLNINNNENIFYQRVFDEITPNE